LPGSSHRKGMKYAIARRLFSLSASALSICAGCLNASGEPIHVRHVEGTLHGFLTLRSEEGKALAAGDLTQTVRGDRVTAQLVFHFKDGSVDDETTVYRQRGIFKLITDRHVQKGPSFPHPMDMTIDAVSGAVTVRTTGKDGKEEVATEHLDLPQDLANGLVPIFIRNISPDAVETKVSMVVATPKPRLVKLAISPRGEESFSIVGEKRKAMHFEIKIELGGVAGVIAPLVGKQPPNIHLWNVGGEAPTFVKETGPSFAEGPIWTIELTSPVWAD
jgi:hypothetical protein